MRRKRRPSRQTGLAQLQRRFQMKTPGPRGLPRQILHMLEDGRLSQSFVHRLLGFVKESYAYHHSHQDYLEEICDGLRAISAEFKRLTG